MNDENKEPKEIKKAVKETEYSKEAFLRDKNYDRDLINALLKDNEMYTKSAVESLICKFKKGVI